MVGFANTYTQFKLISLDIWSSNDIVLPLKEDYLVTIYTIDLRLSVIQQKVRNLT